MEFLELLFIQSVVTDHLLSNRPFWKESASWKVTTCCFHHQTLPNVMGHCRPLHILTTQISTCPKRLKCKARSFVPSDFFPSMTSISMQHFSIPACGWWQQKTVSETKTRSDGPFHINSIKEKPNFWCQLIELNRAFYTTLWGVSPTSQEQQKHWSSLGFILRMADLLWALCWGH